MEDRVIGTYHPNVNEEKTHMVVANLNNIFHGSSDEYTWIHDRIMNWLTEEELPITKLGWEFIVQKYNVGFEFKPHIDDVLSPDKKQKGRLYYPNLFK